MITIETVVSLQQALTLRKIRNECAPFMTNRTKKIGVFAQIRFYFQEILPQKNYYCYLLYRNDEPIGYGLLRIGNGMVTGGVIRRMRGRGYGEWLFRFLSDEAHDYCGEASLEVRKDNERALNLYFKLGYGIVAIEKDRYIMIQRKRYSG